jgi:hypothetical protein
MIIVWKKNPGYFENSISPWYGTETKTHIFVMLYVGINFIQKILIVFTGTFNPSISIQLRFQLKDRSYGSACRNNCAGCSSFL